MHTRHGELCNCKWFGLHKAGPIYNSSFTAIYLYIYIYIIEMNKNGKVRCQSTPWLKFCICIIITVMMLSVTINDSSVILFIIY